MAPAAALDAAVGGSAPTDSSPQQGVRTPELGRKRPGQRKVNRLVNTLGCRVVLVPADPGQTCSLRHHRHPASRVVCGEGQGMPRNPGQGGGWRGGEGEGGGVKGGPAASGGGCLPSPHARRRVHDGGDGVKGAHTRSATPSHPHANAPTRRRRIRRRRRRRRRCQLAGSRPRVRDSGRGRDRVTVTISP